jgi:rRNA maturation endonuclease Nob1
MTTRTSKKKSKRTGEVRCLNCFVRFLPPQGVEKATCPKCGWEWHISWSGKLAKIRKPVWESWERQLATKPKGADEE